MKKVFKITAVLVILLVVVTVILFVVHKNGTVVQTEGRFYGSVEAETLEEKSEVLYQFRSDDNETWWLLTEHEIGHVPNNKDKYILIFNNNGTTKANPPCTCKPDDDCECFVYDDVFLKIVRTG